MKLVNLMKQTVVISANGWEITIPPSGIVASVPVSSVEVELDVEGVKIPVVQTQFGEVQGLPDPAPDTIYITSTLVAMRAGRPDVLAPDTGVGDV